MVEPKMVWVSAALDEQQQEADRRSGVAALRAELADLRNEVEILHSRIAYLESKGRR